MLHAFLSPEDGVVDSDSIVGLQWVPDAREEVIVGVMGRGIS